MVDYKKIVIGFLVILLSTSIIYVTLKEDVKIRIDEDKSTFYIYDGRWKVSGREYNRMFDGNSIMNRDRSGIKINYSQEGDLVTIKRTTPYKRGPMIIDTYTFRGSIEDVELFPIEHKIEILNGEDYFYRYTVDDLKDVPPKRKLIDELELEFGLNMKLTLHPGYRWAWIGWPYGSDSVSAQYKLDSDYEVFYIRFFDPVQSDFPNVRLGDAITVTPTPYSYHEKIVKDSSGVIHTLWVDQGADASYSNSTNNGESFGIIVNFYQGTIDRVNLVINGSDALFGSYVETSNEDIMWNISTDGGLTWTQPAQFPFDGNNTHRPADFSMAVDDDNIIHMCFTTSEWDDVIAADYLIYRNYTNGVWSDFLLLVTDTSNDVDYCDIDTDTEGRVYIMNMGSDQDTIDLFISTNWSDRIPIYDTGTSSSDRGLGGGLFIDSNDKIVMSIADFSSDRLIFVNTSPTSLQEKNWTLQVLVSGVEGNQMAQSDVKISKAGEVYIMYDQDFGVGHPYHIGLINSSDMTNWDNNFLINLTSNLEPPATSMGGSRFSGDVPDGKIFYQYFNQSGANNGVYFGQFNILAVEVDTTPPEITLINLTTEGGEGQLVNISDRQCENAGCKVPRTNSTTPSYSVETNENSDCAAMMSNDYGFVVGNETQYISHFQQNATDESQQQNSYKLEGEITKVEDAYFLNGTDGNSADLINLTRTDDWEMLDDTDQFTLGIRFKLETNYSGKAYGGGLISQRRSDSVTLEVQGETGAGGPNQIRFGMDDTHIISTNAIELDRIYYVIGTYSGESSAGSGILYIDGVENITGDIFDAMTFTNALYIGYEDRFKANFTGTIYEAWVMARNISAQEALDISTNGIASNMNYSKMIELNASRVCGTTGTQNHVCDIIDSDALSVGVASGFIGCKDSTGNENSTSTSGMFLVNISDPNEGKNFVNLTLLFDGLNQSRKYEFETTANITIIVNVSTAESCLDINKDINVSCGTGNWSYFFNITELLVEEIINGSMRFNMSEGVNDNIALKIDNNTMLIKYTMNLTGYDNGGFPTNITIDIDKRDGPDVIMPGKLRDRTLETDTFIFSNQQHSALNVSFSTGTSTLININASNIANLLNFSMLLGGSDLDADNEFNFVENFTYATGVNKTLSFHTDAPFGIFDDFVVNVTDRWEVTQVSGNELATISYTSDGHGNYLVVSGGTSGATSSGGNYKIEYNDVIPDIRNTSLVILDMNPQTSCSRPANADCTSGASANLFATDGTSTVTLKSYSSSCSATETKSTSGVRNITLIRKSDDYKTWEVLINGSSEGNKDLSSLDFENQIELQWTVSWQRDGPGSGPACSASAAQLLYQVDWGGVWLNRSTNNGTYKSDGNFTSTIIQTTQTNVSTITLTAIDNKPDNTAIEYYVSNTCNATSPTFESVQSGILHSFSTVGNKICYRASLSSTVNITSPMVRKVTLETSKGSLSNISVDFGSDGTTDWNFPGTLNSTTSPKRVNGTMGGFEAYRSENCLGFTPTCDYPVSISTVSGGTLEIKDVNSTLLVQDINFNVSKIENHTIVNNTITFLNGILEMAEFLISFRGSKNFSVIGRAEGPTLTNVARDNLTLQVLYSPFNVTYPYGINSFFIIVSATPSTEGLLNQSAISPVGQIILTNESRSHPIFNVTCTAYDDPVYVAEYLNVSIDSCITIEAGPFMNMTNTSILSNDTLEDVAINLTCNSGTNEQRLYHFVNITNCNVSKNIRFEPTFCFNSWCQDCVRTGLYESNKTINPNGKCII